MAGILRQLAVLLSAFSQTFGVASSEVVLRASASASATSCLAPLTHSQSVSVSVSALGFNQDPLQPMN